MRSYWWSYNLIESVGKQRFLYHLSPSTALWPAPAEFWKQAVRKGHWNAHKTRSYTLSRNQIDLKSAKISCIQSYKRYISIDGKSTILCHFIMATECDFYIGPQRATCTILSQVGVQWRCLLHSLSRQHYKPSHLHHSPAAGFS